VLEGSIYEIADVPAKTGMFVLSTQSEEEIKIGVSKILATDWEPIGIRAVRRHGNVAAAAKTIYGERSKPAQNQINSKCKLFRVFAFYSFQHRNKSCH